MHIAITGASGGLGAALAREYARPGVMLSLTGRDAGRLAGVAEACRARGARARTADFDIRDNDALTGWLAGCGEAERLDLFFANAGVSLTVGPDGVESPADLARLLAVNATATIVSTAAAARLMAAAGGGHIAVICSLAGMLPLPDSPGYSAAKSAARTYGLALRQGLRRRGVAVTVVCPGYLDTPMGRRLTSPTPFLWTAERAARHIHRRLPRNPAELAFPLPLALGIRLLDFLPRPLAAWFAARFAFRIAPDAECGPAGGGRP